MSDLDSSNIKRSGTAGAELLEELESYRRRVRKLERNLAERDLQEAADQKIVVRLAEVFRQAQIRAWCWTTEARLTRYLSIRGDVRDAGGQSANEISLTEEQLLQAIHPDNREQLAGVWDRAYEEHEPYEIEYRLVLSDGEVRHNHEIGIPEFDESGRYLGHIGTTQDITERKQAEAALRESDERYRELFDESPVAIWVEDWSPIKQILDDLAQGGVKDWRGYFDSHRDQLRTAYDLAEVIDISRATIKLYRKESKEHMLRMTAAAVVIDEELDAFREMILSFLAGQMTVDIEAKDTVGDGSEIMVRRQVVLPPKYHGDWSRVIFAIEDISERARLEGQLRQAQKMEAVGQLTAGVAHDFNNMLAVISGNAELLEDELGKDNPRLATVLRATERGAELTQHLLAFSRKQVLNPEIINANNLIADITGLLRRTLEEHIDIEAVASADLWNCEIDPAQLGNALVNLALNARDAMPDGGKLTIETANTRLDDDYAAAQADVKPGQYVMLAVTDTGSGMPPEVREHVFEPFYTTKAVGAGSGLGLSMVYGFVKQSGGHVTIYSEEGEGTTIKLYLPRSAETKTVERKPAANEVPAARGETVLVVEDDPEVRTLAVALLSSLGYQIMEAATAAAALEQLGSTTRINLLLTDVMLAGGMNGRELAAEAEQCAPGLPVLYMSGYTADAIMHHGRLDADAELLQKPFRRADLAQAVRKVLDGPSA